MDLVLVHGLQLLVLLSDHVRWDLVGPVTSWKWFDMV